MQNSLLQETDGVIHDSLKSKSEASVYKRHTYTMAAGFFLLFFSFNTVQAFQSQLQKEVGYIGLGLLYFSFCLFCIPGPRLIKIFGPKWSMIIGGLPYVCTIAANIKMVPILYYIINVFTGFGAAVLWTSQGVYLARCASQYRKYTNISSEQSTSEFNGIFFSIYQFTGTSGCIIGGLLLERLKPSTMFIIMSIVALLGLLIFFFIKNVEPVDANDIKDASFLETLRLVGKDRKMQFSILIIMYNGMSLGFCFSDFMSFVGDHTSKSISGYVLALFYFVNTIFSYLFGRIASLKRGRSISFLSSTICCGLFYIALLFWKDPSNTIGTKLLCFLLSAIFAVGDSFFESQIPAILQSFYDIDADRSASMSNYKMWQSLGFAAQFAIGVGISNTRLWLKSSIVLIMLILGSIFLAFLHSRIMNFDSASVGKKDETLLVDS